MDTIVEDPKDIVDIPGIQSALPGRHGSSRAATERPWLGVWFRCCSVYSRIYRDPSGLQYEGPCPRCGARVSARIGKGGTSKRMFETR